MRFALSLPNFVPTKYGEPGTIHRFVGWARAAEQAGWDGFFVWDHMLFWKSWTPHVEDPWILMAAIAAATDRIRTGPCADLGGGQLASEGADAARGAL